MAWKCVKVEGRRDSRRRGFEGVGTARINRRRNPNSLGVEEVEEEEEEEDECARQTKSKWNSSKNYFVCD